MRLIVDHCEASEITEDIAASVEDRSACEAREEVPGERFILSVSTPLQLGGRARPSVNYPAGLTAQGFNGCIRNLRHNGQVRAL